MTDPTVGEESHDHDGATQSASTMPAPRQSLLNSTAIEKARSACRSVAVFGKWAGWGFVMLGTLYGVVPLVEMVGASPAGPLVWVGAGLRAAFLVLAFVLAGWGVVALARVTAASILEYLERTARLSEHLAIRSNEALALLERIAISLEQPREAVASSSGSPLDRARPLAEIVSALKAADWSLAETRLNDFAACFPAAPELSKLREELTTTRNDIIKSGLDQLDAARAANDTDRVLEIYLDLARSLDDERRAALDRDLAKWLLNLIHRRLRTGKVQADVVQLATRFAETFATTVEGASVRASLPTLRRSVGLCPRCAQPYIGVAQACPDCLKGPSPALATLPSGPDTDQPH